MRKNQVDSFDGHDAGKGGRLGTKGLLMDNAVKGVDLLSTAKVTAVFHKQGRQKPFREPDMVGAPFVITPQSHAKSQAEVLHPQQHRSQDVSTIHICLHGHKLHELLMDMEVVSDTAEEDGQL